MEQKVSGCDGCPYFASEGSIHYQPICEHPCRPVKYGIWDSGNFYELPRQIAPDGLYQGGGYSVCFNTEPLSIKLDNNSDPITPDWCPLKKESITISLQPKQKS